MLDKIPVSIKRLTALILAIILSVFALTGCGEEKAEFNFNLAHFFPGTHPAETVFIQGWIKAVEEVSEGKISITSYPGETLLPAAGVYNGVIEGVADIGLSCFSYTVGRFPVLEAFELPGVTYNNSKVASMVAWEGIRELAPAEVQDTHLMMVIATGPGHLFTKTPVRDLNDLKGMEIRAMGLSATAISLLGGTPVSMSQSEAYESLQKSVVKGNLSPVEVLQGWKHAEVTDYLTLTPFLYNTLFYVTFNKDKWESMPQDLRDKVTAATEDFHEKTGIGMWDMQNEPALEYAVEETDMTVIELTDEEKALWVEKVTPLQETYTEKVRDLVDTDVMDYIKSLADKYNAIYP
ncbi:TRAP transporter substrate-binding protein [Candidatus Nomurabacteria bacterium]|nr:TRAP transporter substrate-binding protein [Candidatus Nomurabacteria bacterium]